MSDTTTNPFSTCFIKPGQVRYFFDVDQDANELIQRLKSERWTGQILGPHGTGKSTLIEELKPLICRELESERVLQEVVHVYDDKNKKFEQVGETLNTLNANDVVIVDGYEQWSFWQRRKIQRTCRNKQIGLLVTAHHCVGLPTIYETSTSLNRFRQVVLDLTVNSSIKLDIESIKLAYQNHQPNIREALFALYDVYENVRRSKQVPDS